MNEKLTTAQSEILIFIKETCSKTGMPPSYREIQIHFEYKSVNSVQTHVEALRRKGVLEAAPGKNEKRQARSGLLPSGHKWDNIKQIPIYGVVAAGSPRDSAQLELGSLIVSDEISKTATFALRVTGDSMIEAGIFEGDHLVVDRKARVKHGDIVVALLDGETTVKRYSDKAGQVHLIPENKNLKPISVKGRKLEIQGKVVGLQRKF